MIAVVAGGIDANGDGQPDSADDLAKLAITQGELATLTKAVRARQKLSARAHDALLVVGPQLGLWTALRLGVPQGRQRRRASRTRLASDREALGTSASVERLRRTSRSSEPVYFFTTIRTACPGAPTRVNRGSCDGRDSACFGQASRSFRHRAWRDRAEDLFGGTAESDAHLQVEWQRRVRPRLARRNRGRGARRPRVRRRLPERALVRSLRGRRVGDR